MKRTFPLTDSNNKNPPQDFKWCCKSTVECRTGEGMGIVNNHRANHKQTNRRLKHRNDSTFLAPLSISNHFWLYCLTSFKCPFDGLIKNLLFLFFLLAYPERFRWRVPKWAGGYNAIYISLGWRLKLSSRRVLWRLIVERRESIGKIIFAKKWIFLISFNDGNKKLLRKFVADRIYQFSFSHLERHLRKCSALFALWDFFSPFLMWSRAWLMETAKLLIKSVIVIWLILVTTFWLIAVQVETWARHR